MSQQTAPATSSSAIQGAALSVDRIPFDQIPQFSQRDRAHVARDPKLQPFIKYEVSLEDFAGVMNDKSSEDTDRNLLVEVLREQYADTATEATRSNIDDLLNDHTYTVTTAHQPSLFTGPLYYVYKIISTLNLADRLRAQYPEHRFVPIFITGGEDHDFEEINHLNIFGKTIEWESGETGPVGRMSTKTLDEPLKQLRDILGNSDHAAEIYKLIESTHRSAKTYGQAAVKLAQQLFGKYGLVVLNMDHPKLKARFAPYIEREIIGQTSAPLVEESIAGLEAAGFGAQASPREINFFYLQPQSRERIVFEEDLYKVLNSELQFTEAELRQEIQKHPERFSPNVVMRPIYQELILPNLAYIGGGGEIAYWMERKSQFEAFGINFPMLIRRNSALWVDKTSAKKLDKLGLTVTDLLADEEAVVKQWLRNNADEELNLKAEKKELQQLFERVTERMRSVDPTLGKAAKAEAVNQLKSLSQLESRLIRAEKQKHETAVGQIRSVREKLFPGNGMQERSDNFLQFYLQYGADYFEVLREAFDPLLGELVVIRPEK